MRREERIDEILEKIRIKWKEVPEQRLGQLLINHFGFPVSKMDVDETFNCEDIFNIPDSIFDVKEFE